MSDDIQAEIMAVLDDGDEHPDPEGVATALCAHCTFPVVQGQVRTGRQFFGTFWREAWVHTDTGETRCWSPNASPDRSPQIHPSYMSPGGSGPLEPWHWEYGTE